ncbi:Transcriptional regulatory protein DegU [Thauera sp. GDN1]|uniref:helix-turn-helix transcriptional regulator n=1 Tax=Thauera sp. GDN1 TaxID=2944810 RepID=UPI0024783A0C|nr:response regulator transcription factor [Thauera sp. GDN1]WEN41314.1 Transcriptional regulatory protein DegU [Thauera sp. GDN1]
MMRHFFLTQAGVAPSARWCEAFPEGEPATLTEILDKAGGGDLVWMSSRLEDWAVVLARVADSLPDCPVVLLSLRPDDEEGLRALDAGARGYCHEMAAMALLREVALVVAHQGLWVGPALLSRFLGAVRSHLPFQVDAAIELPAVLSVRELEVARAVSEGLTNKEVAARLGITERTVKAHLGAVFEKLGVRDRLQLVLRLAGRVGAEAVDQP